MEDLITSGADQYNKLKIELEMNIQALKQQLEEIRATYQLNTEKLDYNYRVLTELDVEKNAELARYKRRLNKLKGAYYSVLQISFNYFSWFFPLTHKTLLTVFFLFFCMLVVVVLLGQLNILVSKYTEMEASDSKTNHELTEDYRTLTLKYKDLQAKFRHFEIADTTKYDEGTFPSYIFLYNCDAITSLTYIHKRAKYS